MGARLKLTVTPAGTPLEVMETNSSAPELWVIVKMLCVVSSPLMIVSELELKLKSYVMGGMTSRVNDIVCVMPLG